MGGSSGGSTQTIQKADPWSGAQPYLREILARAQDLYQNYTPEMYPGQMYADPNMQQYMGLESMGNWATAGFDPLMSAGAGGAEWLLSGGAMDPASNPWLQENVRYAAQPVVDQLLGQVMPSIRSDALLSGQYGGSRQGLAESGAIAGAADTIGNISAGMYSDAYNSGLNAMQRTQAMLPQLFQTGLMQGQTMGQIGSQLQAWDQQGIDEAISRWDFTENQPYDLLQQFAGFAFPAAGMGSTMVGSQDMASNPLMGALGMGTLGYMLPGMLGSYASAAGPTMSPMLAGMGPMGWALMLGGLGLGFM